MKNSTITSAIAGFAASALLFGFSDFQVLAQPATERVAWPPRPSLILNWTGEDLGLSQGNSLSIPANGSQVLLSVPNDRWLILSYYEGFDPFLRLAERAGGLDSFKRSLSGSAGSGGGPSEVLGAVGTVFGPGSEVVVQNPTGQNRSLNFSASLTGYYSR